VQARLAHAAKPVVPWRLRIFVDGQMSHFLSAVAMIVAAGAAASPALGAELAPTGTLRATFIATNPVQAKAGS
jgi:hypothetical protein